MHILKSTIKFSSFFNCQKFIYSQTNNMFFFHLFHFSLGKHWRHNNTFSNVGHFHLWFTSLWVSILLFFLLMATTIHQWHNINVDYVVKWTVEGTFEIFFLLCDFFIINILKVFPLCTHTMSHIQKNGCFCRWDFFSYW